MDGPAFFTFSSNAAPRMRARVAESLAIELASGNRTKPVLINLDPGATLRMKAGRQSREDPVARYGGALGSSGIPLLKPPEAADFLEDASKPRNAAWSESRSFIALMDGVPSAEAIPLFDALCLAVTPSPASTAFVYGAVKSMQSAGKTLQMRIMVVGEPRIEKTAEFYAAMAAEIRSLGSGFDEIVYAGFVAYDQEETELANSYGMPTVEAFPEGVTRGQVKQAVRMLFAKDVSESGEDWAERERGFARYLRLQPPR